jgi:hypothetical protein
MIEHEDRVITNKITMGMHSANKIRFVFLFIERYFTGKFLICQPVSAK